MDYKQNFVFHLWYSRLCVCVYTNLPWAQRDQTDVLAEGAFLNLMNKLGQLGVSATAVVNLWIYKTIHD